MVLYRAFWFVFIDSSGRKSGIDAPDIGRPKGIWPAKIPSFLGYKKKQESFSLLGHNGLSPWHHPAAFPCSFCLIITTKRISRQRLLYHSRSQLQNQ
jgi:hypothetical protein